LGESVYQPVADGPTHHVTVSDRGSRVSIGARPLKGQRTTAFDSYLAYDLREGTFAGGRFVVWPGEHGPQAELTIYGSGRPIVRSERGALVPAF
jgi:hypothetical protein